MIKGEGKYIAQKLPQEAQYSSIRDFYWDQNKKQLFYVGNAQEFVTEIGNAAANPGGVISVGSNEAFRLAHQAFLPLPVRFNMRSLKPLGKDSFLLLTNNDYVYLATTNNSSVYH